ncbi:MAG: heavy metal translocating P-type ATPase [Cyanobacteria bacterium P01_D01_bin.56]
MDSTVLPPPVPQELSPAVAVLNVDGMMCAGCVQAVETQLLECDGVAMASVNLITKAAAVQYQANVVAPEQLATVLTEAGFPSELRQGNHLLGDWAEQQAEDQQGQGWRLAIALTLLILSIIGHLNHIGSPANIFSIPILSTLWFHFALATLTLAVPARGILQDGWTGIRRGRPNMNTLVGIGALSAYLASVVALVFPNLGWECFFDEPVMLLSFILLGRTLEERARFRATAALRSLIALQPSDAHLVAGTGQTVDIPITQVQVGDLLQVLPGDKIPVDGQIEQGQTSVDEAMVTGESLLVTKQPGDPVIGGTLNQSGLITLKVQRTGAESTLAQMITLVESAQTRKAPIQGLADTLSGYFTYGILALALLTFLFWYGAGVTLWPDAAQAAINPHHGHHGHMVVATSRLLVSLKLSIAVVVIACPCALGLATPMAILVGSGIGAQRGLLVRGGDVLEHLHQLDTIIFDKTGTLTTGKPWVTNCISYDPKLTEDDVIQLAASVEQGTRHPLAAAILAESQQRQLTLHEVTNSVTEPGLGVSATWQDKAIHLGNDAWLAKANIFTDVADQDIATLAAQGKTLVYIAFGEHLVGVVALADRPRPDAHSVIQQLKQQQLTVQLLSGDRPDAVHRIALDLGIPVAKGQMTPADKVQAIERLQAAGHRIGFVGDGINDAPALAQANVAIAMHSGTEIAMETADIVLMRDELTDVLAALELGRSTFNKIQQNLAWAFGYNLVCIPLAAGVLLPKFGIALSPGFAGGFMAFSSIGVVLNSLLLRWQLGEKNA